MPAAGEGPEHHGDSLIKEESAELDLSADGRPDVAGDAGQAEEEEENSSILEQQTQESEVRPLDFMASTSSIWLPKLGLFVSMRQTEVLLLIMNAFF